MSQKTEVRRRRRGTTDPNLYKAVNIRVLREIADHGAGLADTLGITFSEVAELALSQFLEAVPKDIEVASDRSAQAENERERLCEEFLSSVRPETGAAEPASDARPAARQRQPRGKAVAKGKSKAPSDRPSALSRETRDANRILSRGVPASLLEHRVSKSLQAKLLTDEDREFLEDFWHRVRKELLIVPKELSSGSRGSVPEVLRGGIATDEVMRALTDADRIALKGIEQRTSESAIDQLRKEARWQRELAKMNAKRRGRRGQPRKPSQPAKPKQKPKSKPKRRA